MNTQYRKNLKSIATACKNYTDNKITELKWELGSHTLDVESDTDTKYRKVVPANTIGCQINSIGGMSYKSENLLVLNDVAETTTNGITYKVENGVITFNGTATSSFTITFDLYADIPSGTYYSNFFTDNNTLNFDLYFNNTSINVSDFSQQLLSFNTNVYNMLIFIASGRSYTNYVVKPMLISGSTAPTNWKQGFEGIRDTATTSVVSKDSSNVTIDTLTIPSQVQALTGYGWGINDTCFNYINFKNKKFIPKVDRVDLGSLNWQKLNNRILSSNLVNTIKCPINNSDVANILTAKYKTASYNNVYDHSSDKIISVQNNGNLGVYDTEYYDNFNEQTFKTAMSGVYLYYELATPVETDISAYLTTDTIDVEGGGSLEFTNTYSQDVPSDIDYLIEEVKA